MLNTRNLLLAPLALTMACGGTEVPDDPVPTAVQVRQFMGAVSGNCYRYRIPTGQISTFATMSIAGPDERPIAGRSVYIRSLLSESGNDSLDELLDFASAPEVRLARSINGRGAGAVINTYDTDPLPLFGTVEFDAMNNVTFAEQVFRTTSTSKESGMAEDHQWTVLGEEEVTLHDGTTAMGTKLSYNLAGATAFYWLVPGYGFAKFTDFNSRGHQVCAACVSDTDGGCTQQMCQELATAQSCNQ